MAVVPAGLRYDQAAARLRDLLAAGTPVGAVLVAGDEGVLVANRLPAGLPVIDQVDAAAAAACRLLVVEVRPPGHALDLLADPVALGARLGLGDAETGDAVTVSRALADHSNAVVGLLARSRRRSRRWAGRAVGGRGWPVGPALRAACARIAGWPVGAVQVFGTASGEAEVDDLFAVDLAAAAEAATARQGSTGRAVLVASLGRGPGPPGRAGRRTARRAAGRPGDRPADRAGRGPAGRAHHAGRPARRESSSTWARAPST